MEIILGLDISTHCIGMTICSVEDNMISVMEITHLRLNVPKKIKGVESLLIKTNLLKDKLKTFTQYHISKVIIEEPQINPNKELTNMLLKLNGMISVVIYEVLGIVPNFITSKTARMFALPELMGIRKFNKNGVPYKTEHIINSIKNNELVLFGGYQWDISKKYLIFNIISTQFPNIKWLYNSDGDLSNENFDACDSLICILGFLKKEKYNTSQPLITTYNCENIDNKTIINYTFTFCDNSFDKKIIID